jgi:hypothetical protein
LTCAEFSALRGLMVRSRSSSPDDDRYVKKSNRRSNSRERERSYKYSHRDDTRYHNNRQRWKPFLDMHLLLAMQVNIFIVWLIENVWHDKEYDLLHILNLSNYAGIQLKVVRVLTNIISVRLMAINDPLGVRPLIVNMKYIVQWWIAKMSEMWYYWLTM